MIKHLISTTKKEQGYIINTIFYNLLYQNTQNLSSNSILIMSKKNLLKLKYKILINEYAVDRTLSDTFRKIEYIQLL